MAKKKKAKTSPASEPTEEKQEERPVDTSMPGYTQAQKTRRRALIIFMVLVFVLLVFIPIYGVSHRNNEQKAKTTTAATKLNSAEQTAKQKKIDALRSVCAEKISVQYSGKMEDYSFTDVNQKDGAVYGKTNIKISGYSDTFVLHVIYSSNGNGYQPDYIYINGEVNGQKAAQLVLNDGKYNSFLSARGLPTVGQNMKTS